MDYVTLSNGKKVDWDEFSKWSSIKQKMSINPPNKGRKFSEEFKKNISQRRRMDIATGKSVAIKGGKHANSRSVTTPDGYFETVKEAGLHYSVRGSTIREWIKRGKDGFQYSSPPTPRKAPTKKGGVSGGLNKSARAVLTPIGRFCSLKEAATALEITVGQLSLRIKKSANGEYAYETERENRNVGLNPNRRKNNDT